MLHVPVTGTGTEHIVKVINKWKKDSIEYL
jgi:hypothetical protein